MARVSDFFFKRIQVLKKIYFEGVKVGLASVSEFVLQRIQI